MRPIGSIACERAMKIQEVILRAMAKRITYWQAAEIIGISDRQMRRWHLRNDKGAMTDSEIGGAAGRVHTHTPANGQIVHPNGGDTSGDGDADADAECRQQ